MSTINDAMLRELRMLLQHQSPEPNYNELQRFTELFQHLDASLTRGDRAPQEWVRAYATACAPVTPPPHPNVRHPFDSELYET